MKRKFVTPDSISGDEIKLLRKELGLTQKEFAELINVSKPTIERWESGSKPVTGPMTLLTQILKMYPEHMEEFTVPEKSYRLRLWYMYENTVCTIIDVDEIRRKVKIKNFNNNIMYCAFGVKQKPDFHDYEEFLESRCFPRTRDKMKLMLQEFDLPFYDPLMIIEKTAGRVEGDNFWIKIEWQGGE